LRRNEGFIVLAGDIGTGKTTLCRALVQQLDATTFTSLVRNPFVSIEELLREVLVDFGIASRDAARSGRLAAASRQELITALHDFLLSLVPLRGSCVLIIDEAQHLSPDVLEQIRLVANLETNEAKLLQIVLVGQLNLLDTLAAAEMRQLAQRVSLRARLKPLTPAEVAGYVAHRLSVASHTAGTGGSAAAGSAAAGSAAFDAATFDPEALTAIHRFTGGVPRVINLLCDRALALGAQCGAARVDAATVAAAAAALEITVPDGVRDRSTMAATSDAGRKSPDAVDGHGVTDRTILSIAAAPTDAAAAAAGSERRRAVAFGVAVTLMLVLLATAAVMANVRVDLPPSPPAPPFTLRLPAPIAPLAIPDPPPPRVRRQVPPPPEPSQPTQPTQPGAEDAIELLPALPPF
jgi:general secretion pathway protein A